MGSCQRDRDEPTSDGQRVNHWLIEKLSPYARNPRTYSDAQIAQIAVSTAGLESKPESGLYQGRHHRRAAGACSPRESSSSKTFPSLVENLGTDRRICSIGHRYRDSRDVSFPKNGREGTLLSLRI
jgi:hypothetical protein